MNTNPPFRIHGYFMIRVNGRGKSFFRIFLILLFLFFLSPNSTTQVPNIDLSIEKLAPQRIRAGERIHFVLNIKRLDRFPVKALGVTITDILDTAKLSYRPESVQILPLFDHPILLDESLKFTIPDDFSHQTPFP